VRHALLRPVLRGAAAAILGLAVTTDAPALDAAAAEALMKKSNCFKCHAVDRKKNGPSFKETASKYKGKPDAQKILFVHLTTNPKVKIDDKEETHDSLKTKNEGEVNNVIEWILSR
jgi:cytochrome c